jgi:hypothetical protein
LTVAGAHDRDGYISYTYFDTLGNVTTYRVVSVYCYRVQGKWN